MGQSLLIILFTDIENSTALTQKLGDVRAQAEVVRIHNAYVRSALASRGGTEVKHTGDGIMATFPSAIAAVSCAIAIQEASRQHNQEHPDSAFNVRIGLNAGEPVAEDKDVFGTAVQLAARILAQAAPGQVLASDVVRQLIAGKGLVFKDMGAFEMKGFDAPVPVFEISAEREIGEQLWREAQEQTARPARFSRRVLVAAGAVIAIGAATAAFLLLSDSGGGNTNSAPDYRIIRFQQHTTGTMDVVRGDCTSTDIVFRGGTIISSEITGDVTGEATASTFEARVRAATGCTSMSLLSRANWSFASSDSVWTQTVGYSSRPLIGVDLDALSGGADVHDSGVIFGGTGVYAGTAGKSSCDSVGLRVGIVTGTQVGYDASNNCILLIAPIGELGAITLSNAADTTAITTQGGVAGANDQLTAAAVYHNNRDFALTGLVLHLPAPAGVRLEPIGEGGSTEDGGISWDLPDLAPDAVAQLEFTVRLLASDADQITLVPEITGDQLDASVRGDAITLTIAR